LEIVIFVPFSQTCIYFFRFRKDIFNLYHPKIELMVEKYSLQTRCVHSGTRQDESTCGVNTPVYTSTSFGYLDTDARVYPRYFNTPNLESIARKICALEHGEDGFFVSSGMAAMSTVLLTLLKKGDHAVFQKSLYGGATHFVKTELELYGISYSITDGLDVSSFAKELKPNTRLIYIETPSNPLMNIVDIGAIAILGKSKGITTIIDNTFASPINQNPIDFGIDVVIHSATKYIGGHSDICAGAIVSNAGLIQRMKAKALNFGGSLNAQTCYLIERSMKTLYLRVTEQTHNALALARHLEGHPAIQHVYYPGLESHPDYLIAKKQMNGFGGMLSFELKELDSVAFQKKLKLIKPAMSLGGIDTIICAPSITSHRHSTQEERLKEGISDGLLRLSVGIEDVNDLLTDINQALQ
jgi:cystathionine beta-lyase/cystathionine gamma-synthase